MVFPYRADHIGSLLRPPELLRAREGVAAGSLSPAQLRDLEDAAILAMLDLQRSLGLDVLTDGELRRAAWLSDLAEAVDGFVPDHVTLEWQGGTGEARPSMAAVVGGPLRQMRRITEHESQF